MRNATPTHQIPAPSAASMPSTSGAADRVQSIDVLRGIAMVWMTAFHFCFDLQYFGYLHTSFYDNPIWTWQRSAIVSLFVFSAGLGQSLAAQQGLSWARFGKRWLQIVGGALLVSAGSYGMFPDSFIYFGILHGMALMLLLGRALAVALQPRWAIARVGLTALLIGVGALAVALPTLGLGLHSRWPGADALNTPLWNWLGLISRKPITEDYAPLFPWFGVFLWGLAAGAWWPQNQPAHAGQPRPNARSAPHRRFLKRLPRGLAWLGRHSLPYYLLHQPLLIGGFMLLQA